MDIPGKVCIVTGASAGIGLATARRLAAEGAKVVLAARSAETLLALAVELRQRGCDASPVPTDIRSRAAVELLIDGAFRHHGRIDLLINNAGQAAAGTVADVSPDDFRSILDLNVFGVLYAMQAVVPKMRQGGGGGIVNVSSMVSKMRLPGLAAYAATKSALNMLSDTARVELAPENIRVITVYPRLTATDFGEHSLGDPEVRRRQRAGVPGNTVVDPPEFVAERIMEAVRKEPAEQYMDA
jgi:NAD(P)-dependent dehydrogenase (short-subunit alcohol dehydrogenase family)